MKNIEVGIVGSRGFAGAELNKRLSSHPVLNAVNLDARGDTFADGVPEVVIFALPDKLGSKHLDDKKVKKAEPIIVDMSYDHRFDTSWAYGLPEHFRTQIEGSRLISNPGCYATAMQLGIRPALKFIDTESIVASGTSGYTGAGKTPSRKNDSEVLTGNHVVPYSTIGHQHEKEVATHLEIGATDLRFMPRVGNFPRGIILEVRMRAKFDGFSPEKLFEHYKESYANEDLVVVSDEMPDLRDVVETDKCLIGGFQVIGREIGLVVMIDNLGKGAAGQAVQNLNVALSILETTGLVLEKKMGDFPKGDYV